MSAVQYSLSTGLPHGVCQQKRMTYKSHEKIFHTECQYYGNLLFVFSGAPKRENLENQRWAKEGVILVFQDYNCCENFIAVSIFFDFMMTS